MLPPMAEFPVNPQRFDPYKNFKFRLKWDGKYVAGVSKVSGLKRTTEVVEHREGGDPSTSRKSTGLTQFEAITLERGLTQDLDFVAWANSSQVLDKGSPSQSLANLRKEVRIDLLNENGLVTNYQMICTQVRQLERAYRNAGRNHEGK